MKRLIAMIAVLVLLLAGCAGDDGTIVGTWEQEINVVSGLTETFVDEQAAYFLDIDDVPFYMTVTFDEDGTYTTKLNVEGSKAGLKKFVDAWVSATMELWEALLEQNESEATVNEMLADFEDYYGKPLREKLSEQIVLEEFAKNLETSGSYRVDGDKLYRNADESIYETFMIRSGTLYIVSSSDPNLSEEDAAGYPYKFERVA